MDRLRNLPLWLRLLFIALPFLMCIPIICIIVFSSQQLTGLQSTTVTAAAEQTQQAAAATGKAEKEQRLTATAAALAVTQTANAFATATAIVLQNEGLTQTALVVPTETATLTEVPATDTRVPVFNTATPKLVTITLRECRGYEGTIIFGQEQPRSINAYKSVTFTVPPGKYNLRIDWFQKPENNINTQIEFLSSQTITYGQCP